MPCTRNNNGQSLLKKVGTRVCTCEGQDEPVAEVVTKFLRYLRVGEVRSPRPLLGLGGSFKVHTCARVHRFIRVLVPTLVHECTHVRVVHGTTGHLVQ